MNLRPDGPFSILWSIFYITPVLIIISVDVSFQFAWYVSCRSIDTWLQGSVGWVDEHCYVAWMMNSLHF